MPSVFSRRFYFVLIDPMMDSRPRANSLVAVDPCSMRVRATRSTHIKSSACVEKLSAYKNGG